MRRWNLILRVFMSEYLHLRPEVASVRQRFESELVRFRFLWYEFISMFVVFLTSRDTTWGCWGRHNTLLKQSIFLRHAGRYSRRGREGRGFRRWSSVQQIFELLDHGGCIRCHLTRQSLSIDIAYNPNYMRTFSFSLTCSKWARACLENFLSAVCRRAG